MNDFGFRTVLKLHLSRLRPGYFLILLFFTPLSCKRQPAGKDAAPEGQLKEEIKIAKTVPPVYLPVSDKGFEQRQDTVYYQGRYFTGYRLAYYPSGDTAVLQSYFNGVEEGFQKKWYANKQLAEIRFYINGKKEGEHKGWWDNGKPKFYFSLRDNEYEGEFREWNAAGLLIKQFHYHNGHEEGSQRLWWDNGTVRANYVIKNGKKYGLIGLKLCNNPYDSVYKK